VISLDTNIILAYTNPKDSTHSRARAALLSLPETELLVISPVVYAELMVTDSPEDLEVFLDTAQIRILEDMPLLVYKRAGQAFWTYSSMRKKGQLPRRIGADFLIAAHAEHHGARVMTFDSTVYKAVFPQLEFIEP
jgi:predicted nucleic acid-binding protein